jgi:type III restriction enzyme
LRSREDLVVIADEHHVYQERARVFSDAVRDLSPVALVGLTATPDARSRDKVIYTYPLARHRGPAGQDAGPGRAP